MAWDGNVLSHDTDLHVENVTIEQSYHAQAMASSKVKCKARCFFLTCYTGK